MLRYRQIFDFYWPLVLTSQMMTLAAPIINMGLGRSADPKVQLAGYAVGFGLLVFMNSPLFPFVQSNAVLGVGSKARRSLLRKQLGLASVFAVLQLVLALSPGGNALIARLMGSTPAVADLAQKVALVQWPIPVLITIRSYYYGIIMRHRRTQLISQATGLRLTMLGGLIFGAMGYGHMPGAMLGGAALTAGIASEMLYVTFRGLRLLRAGAAGVDGPEPDAAVSWRRFMDFIGPLMVNAVTWSAMRPVLSAIVGRTADPDLAQASFGFVLPLLILSASPLWAFNNTSIVLVKKRRDLPVMLRFGLATIGLFIVGIAVVVWTPLRELLLERVFSVTPERALHAAVLPALLLIPYQPITLGLRTITSGFLIAQHRTRTIGVASAIKLVLVVSVGFYWVRGAPPLNGALVGTLLLMGSETLETLIVLVRTWLLVRHEDRTTTPEGQPDAA